MSSTRSAMPGRRRKLIDLLSLPAAPDQAHRNRGQQERDQLRHASHPLLPHPTSEMARVSKSKSHQEQIYEQRQDREQDSNGIDQEQQCSEQRRTRDQRHTERNNSE